MADFHVVPGAAVRDILAAAHRDVLDVVRETYRVHERGETINPDSYFLRFPDKPESRVIALPAYLGGAVDRIGMKWIGSFPGNIADGRPRASAVLILNDYATGYPLACLEAAGISSARTAASAAVAAKALTDGARRVSFIGAGVIARTILDYLRAAGIDIAAVTVHDTDPDSAAQLVQHAAKGGLSASRVDLSDALGDDLVVFATTAGKPYVPAETELEPHQVVLNISLRDLPPELLLRTNNVVDDVDHCLKAQTSPHLAEQLTGSRDFVTGTIGGLLAGDVALAPDRATVFSPFGLGVLDIAVGQFVLAEALAAGTAIGVPGFFGEVRRW